MKTFSKYVIQACSENASHKILTDICDNISMYNNCWIRPKLVCAKGGDFKNGALDSDFMFVNIEPYKSKKCVPY